MARIYSERGSSDLEKKIFASNLNYYIEQSDKTQAQVAKDLGFNATTLNMWCKGNSMPTSGKIQKLADYFHVGKSALVEVPEHSVEYTSTAEEFPEREKESHSILTYIRENAKNMVISDLKAARTIIERQIDIHYEDIEMIQDEIKADLAIEEQRDASDFELPTGWVK